MSAYMYIFKRDKKDGFYQNDMKCEKVAELVGWKAFEYAGKVLVFTFEPEGSAVLSSCDDMGTILESMPDYEKYYMENREYQMKNFWSEKYQFVYRVAEPFFNELLDKKTFKEWAEDVDSKEDKKWVSEQLKDISKLYKTLDFENYYYYVVESY